MISETVTIPNDVMWTIKKALGVYGTFIDEVDWKPAEKATAQSDIQQAFNVLDGRDRFDDGMDD